jgi:diguanylate cyclase (GGDEF)-like protein
MRLTDTDSSGSSDASPARLFSPVWSIAVLIAALLLVFELDRATGSSPVQHLYYLPIIFAGVRFGMLGGVTASLLAILSYHSANPHLFGFRYEESDLVQIVLFIAVGVITAKLKDDAHRLRALAMTDDLTGLHNLRSFEARLATIIHDSRNAGAPVSLLVLDLDRLKALNDKYGHLAGAEAVRTVGHIIAASLPPGAVACRYGGDEFVIALPGCSESQAKPIADELRGKVNDAAPVLAGLPFPKATLSISVGLACRSEGPHTRSRSRGSSSQSASTDDESGEALFRAADRALYLAKESGRNHVFVARRAI